MSDPVLRYDIATDELVPVTQEWVDSVAQLMKAFGAARTKSREFLDAWKPEYEQKP